MATVDHSTPASADIWFPPPKVVPFPLQRRDVQQNTKRQVTAARRSGAADGSLWHRRMKREDAKVSSKAADKVGSCEMGLIASVLCALNYGQQLDTCRGAIRIAQAAPHSPGAQQALELLTAMYPGAAASAAVVEAR